MTFIPCPLCVSIGFEMVISAQPVSVVLHAAKSTAPTITNMEHLAQAVVDAAYAYEGGSTHVPGTSNLSLNSIKMTDLSTSSGPTFDWITGTTADLPYTGGDGPLETGIQTASVVTWQTLARGRSFRGRSYWPAVPQDKLSNAKFIATAYVTVLDLWWAAIHAAINSVEAATWQHGVLSKFTAGAPRPSGILTPITSFRMNSKVGTQRRRVG